MWIDYLVRNLEGCYGSSFSILEMYMRYEFNKEANWKRRNGEGLSRDKDIVYPRLSKIEDLAGSCDIREFFSERKVLDEGLTFGGFVDYLIMLCGANEKNKEDILDDGWRN